MENDSLFNSDYDPMQDLEDCMQAIAHQQELTETFISTANHLLKQNSALIHNHKILHDRVQYLELQLNDLKHHLSKDQDKE